MTLTALIDVKELEARFSGVITPDERAGYEGYLVEVGKLVDFATALRDEYRFIVV